MALHGFLTQHVGTDSMDQKPAAAPEEDTFEKRLAKPADWAALDDDTLAADLDAMAGQVDDTFEAVKAELAAEKAAKSAAQRAAASNPQ